MQTKVTIERGWNHLSYFALTKTDFTFDSFYIQIPIAIKMARSFLFGVEGERKKEIFLLGSS